MSHVSSGSRHSRHHNNRGGLTSENVARFNSGNSNSARYTNSSTLVNTLDLVSVGSESRKKSVKNYEEKSNNNLNVKGDLDLHSSSSSDTGKVPQSTNPDLKNQFTVLGLLYNSSPFPSPGLVSRALA